MLICISCQHQGFVKGLGKGMLGAFTKPAGGLLDFATDTASAVKEAARGPVCSRDSKGIR